jgi:hypothetical protein
MMTEILMDREGWIKHYQRLLDCTDKAPTIRKSLESLNRKAHRHFDRDIWAPKWAPTKPSKKKKCKDTGNRAQLLTCHVIFDNGESLSDIEAIGGLGDVAPKYLKQRIKEAHERRLQSERKYIGGNRDLEM